MHCTCVVRGDYLLPSTEQVGMVYSENEEVIKVVGQMCHASQASTLTLHTIGRLLQEVSFVDDHFEWHQVRQKYETTKN